LNVRVNVRKRFSSQFEHLLAIPPQFPHFLAISRIFFAISQNVQKLAKHSKNVQKHFKRVQTLKATPTPTPSKNQLTLQNFNLNKTLNNPTTTKQQSIL